ncbi:hypothetical protein Ecwhy1_33 [Escherichia phage Ecwhy_1]|uniref:Uncharacterized protein n=1 Tax=Escherichia phage fEgEco12 TaxID=3158837 RepID=A0AAU7PHV0_9CAUD|nr:hypothetical protein Ecwhy1_33 [Escherichia phage Ecwhy_1]
MQLLILSILYIIIMVPISIRLITVERFLSKHGNRSMIFVPIGLILFGIFSFIMGINATFIS